MLRVSEAEIAQARAVSIAQIIGRDVEIKRDFVNCPLHGPEKTPSLHIDRKRNRWHCFGCGAGGDPIEFVKRFRHVDFPTAVKELAGGDYHFLGSGYPRPTQKHSASIPVSTNSDHGDRPTVPASIAKTVSDIWNGADNPRLVEFYLWTRGIRLKRVPDTLRGHNAVLWSEDVGTAEPNVEPPWRTWWSNKTRSWWRGVEKPAVIAAITGDDGEVVAIQRIWVERSIEVGESGLSSKGARAVGLSVPKKTLGPMGSAAVRLAPCQRVLGLAEGVETALSLRFIERFHRIPVWAALGATRFQPLSIPSGVRELMIFGDNGEVGRESALRAAEFFGSQGYAAAAYFPESGFDDFNEQLLAGVKCIR
jgi:DNA primase